VTLSPQFQVGDLVMLALPIQMQLFTEFADFNSDSIGIVKEVIKRKGEIQAFEYQYVVYIEGSQLMFFEYEIVRLRSKS
jgi:hypothetical protein